MKQFSVFGDPAAYLLAGLFLVFPGASNAAEWKVTGQDDSVSTPEIVPDISSQPIDYQSTMPASVDNGSPVEAAGNAGNAEGSTAMAGTTTARGPGSWRMRDTVLTVSVWESEGGTSWNHSARSLNTVFGDPTSELQYQDISGTVVDLGLEVPLTSGFYLDFHYAHSSVDDGILVDDDYLSPEGAAFLGIGTADDLLFSRTASIVDEGTIQAFSATAGREIMSLVDSPFKLRVYAKYQDYSESYHASGVRQLVCASPFLCSPAGSQEFINQRVISNKANWKSVYIGVDGKFYITPRLSISADLAYTPWARVTNDDVHLLRGDLRPDPSIRIQTTGKGINANAQVAYRIGHWEASLGYQYWKLESKSDPNAISFFPADEVVGVDAHLNQIVTRRDGWRVGLSYLFGDGEVY